MREALSGDACCSNILVLTWVLVTLLVAVRSSLRLFGSFMYCLLPFWSLVGKSLDHYAIWLTFCSHCIWFYWYDCWCNLCAQSRGATKVILVGL